MDFENSVQDFLMGPSITWIDRVEYSITGISIDHIYQFSNERVHCYSIKVTKETIIRFRSSSQSITMANDVMSNVIENGYVLDINKNDTPLKGKN